MSHVIIIRFRTKPKHEKFKYILDPALTDIPSNVVVAPLKVKFKLQS